MSNYFTVGAASILARCVSAEVRARLAAERITGREFAARIGMSQNYFATRLRDEKSFTIDDVERIWEGFADDEQDVDTFISMAYKNHRERIWDLQDREQKKITKLPQRLDHSSYDEADEAARNEDTEPPRND